MSEGESIAGFAWPLPRAFAGAASACRFEQGDVLYGDPRGYEAAWPRKKFPGPILQVLDPPKSARTATSDAEGTRFRVNWDSPVTLDVFRDTDDAPTRLTSTQGRLFSCLWKGDLGLLDAEAGDPSPPEGIRVLQRQLDRTVDALVSRLDAGARRRDRQLFVLAVDDASDASRVKAQTIESLLSEAFEVEVVELSPGEAGVEGPETLHPALRVRGIAISTTDAEAISERLTGLLYAGGETTSGRFSLSRHGHLASLAESAEVASD